MMIMSWINQESLCIAADLGEVFSAALVVVDVAPGDGGLREVPDQKLLFQGNRFESIGIDLDDRRVVDTFEEIFSGGLVGEVGTRADWRKSESEGAECG